MPETTPLIKAALNLRGGAGFDVYYQSSFPPENKKTTGKILTALFLSFFGAKIGQNCLSKPFKKSHKVFVLTCGYV